MRARHKPKGVVDMAAGPPITRQECPRVWALKHGMSA